MQRRDADIDKEIAGCRVEWFAVWLRYFMFALRTARGVMAVLTAACLACAVVPVATFVGAGREAVG